MCKNQIDRDMVVSVYHSLAGQHRQSTHTTVHDAYDHVPQGGEVVIIIIKTVNRLQLHHNRNITETELL